jgi:hypothetical protein
VRPGLALLWDAADPICSKLLKALLPALTKRLSASVTCRSMACIERL